MLDRFQALRVDRLPIAIVIIVLALQRPTASVRVHQVVQSMCINT